ncbi:Clavaminate synthase-like protein, partial [Atractiella rhizophila]
MALIVSGAPGRREEVLDLIAHVQFLFPPSSSNDNDYTDKEHGAERPTKRPRLAYPAPTSPPAPPSSSLKPIPRTDPPSLSHFHSPHPTPLILSSYVADWPAVQSWASKDYLLRTAGRGRVVPVEIGGDYTRDGWGQKIIPWENFLSSCPSPNSKNGKGEEENGEIMYLAQHDLFSQFPALLNDIILPDYLYSAPPEGVNEDHPSYRSPTNEDGYVLNCWIGGGGNKSPAHTDPWWNCYAQVVGKKKVWIAPPTLKEEMYPFTS